MDGTAIEICHFDIHAIIFLLTIFRRSVFVYIEIDKQ